MTTSEALIRLSDVGMRFDERTVLSGVSLTVNHGDFLAITGPNGGGKTTLLRIMLKLLRPTSGSVDYLRDGHPTDHLSIGYLPQKNKIDSRFPVSVADVIESGLLAVKGMDRDRRRKLVDEMIELVGLTSHARQPIGLLSGGQLQRALLGRALVAKPKVIVLDEPLSYVDKRFEHHIYDIMDRLKSQATLILVSHEMSTIASMANRHIIIDGSLHECHARHHMVHYDCQE